MAAGAGGGRQLAVVNSTVEYKLCRQRGVLISSARFGFVLADNGACS